MRPRELSAACQEIGERWPDALIYPNPPINQNGYKRNPDVPDNALAVDVDQVWPHNCGGDADCNGCSGWWELVAWIDTSIALVHYTPLGLADIEKSNARP